MFVDGRRALAAALPLAAVLMASAPDARAFCRTTTCPLPPDFTPSPAGCYPPDFAHYCASLSTPAKALPIWWRNACVSYDLSGNGTRQIAYATVAQVVSAAFAKWTGTTCASGGHAEARTGRVSIDVRDLGPVDCNQVQYNSDQGNQHIIAFRDDVWPHNDANNTLGLTTVTYDPATGEIYDADMEINATVSLSTADSVPPGAYDFESIITHETGHFLGMAHSGDDRATMFAHYTPGSSTMRVLTDDDVQGICTVYPPGGVRSVDTSVPGAGQGGLLAESTCDPTPRHGFSKECKNPPSKACAVAAGAPAPLPRSEGCTTATLGTAGIAAFFLARRRQRKSGRAGPPSSLK